MPPLKAADPSGLDAAVISNSLQGHAWQRLGRVGLFHWMVLACLEPCPECLLLVLSLPRYGLDRGLCGDWRNKRARLHRTDSVPMVRQHARIEPIIVDLRLWRDPASRDCRDALLHPEGLQASRRLGRAESWGSHPFSPPSSLRLVPRQPGSLENAWQRILALPCGHSPWTSQSIPPATLDAPASPPAHCQVRVRLGIVQEYELGEEPRRAVRKVASRVRPAKGDSASTQAVT